MAGAEFKKELRLNVSWDEGPRLRPPLMGQALPLDPTLASGQFLPKTTKGPIFFKHPFYFKRDARNSDFKNVQPALAV